MAKILCIYDEGSLINTPLIGAKGFSMLVDSGGKRLLFDTGLKDSYLRRNMDNLDVDPGSIDVVAVSQAHPDNCRALDGLLSQREAPVDVYAPAGLYAAKRGMLSGSVGLSDESREKAVLHDITDWVELIPDVWLSPQIEYQDGYRESVLVVAGTRMAVVSGRGHAGPAPILDAVSERFGRNAATFVGAILLEKKKKPVAQSYAAELSARGCTDLHLNHCTGTDGMTNLRTVFGLKGVCDFYVGMTLEVKTSRRTTG